MTRLEPAGGGPARRMVFSSDQLPAGLHERARRNLWRDIYGEVYGPLDVDYAEDLPFSARFELSRFGSLGIANCVSTVERFVRTPRCVAAAGSDSLHLAVNCGRQPMQVDQRGRSVVVAPRAIALVDDAFTGAFSSGAGNRWLFATLPRRHVLAQVADAEDLVATPLDPGRPAMRHLRSYLGILLGPEGIADDARFDDHVATTLLDLATLLLGAGGEAAALAKMRGRRAARLQIVLAGIRAGYRDQDFSVRRLAAKVRLSPRYIQDLLQETGTSFTERVQELRLQAARRMLTDRRLAGRRIIDIAYACGFNEVSHFNRVFRQRFDATPSDLRAAGPGNGRA